MSVAIFIAARAVRFAHGRIGGDVPQHGQPGRILRDEIAVRLVFHFAADQVKIVDMQPAREVADLCRRTETARGRLGDDEHHVDRVGGGAAQMLHARIHIEQDHFVAVQQDVADQRFQQHAFGANAPVVPQLDRSQFQKPDVAVKGRVLVGNIIGARIDLEIAAVRSLLRARTLEDQIFHLGDRTDPFEQFRREAQRIAQTG